MANDLKELNVINLFCGAGGCECGIREAIVKKLSMTYKGLAINHWDVAVDTMRANFPNVNTLSCKIEEAVPGELIPWGTDIHLLWASPSCFTAGHLVTTSDGQKPIEEVAVGDLVLTHKGRWRRVIRLQARPNLKTVVVQGAGHFGIECTPSHHFWLMPSELAYTGKSRHATREYGVPQWMRIDRALANEALWSTPLMSACDPLPEKPMPEQLKKLKDPWWVIGRWLGDGWASKGRHTDTTICCAHCEERELASMLSDDWSKFVDKATTTFTLSSREVRDWFIETFSTGAAEKQIPSWCLTMSLEKRKSLWDGYLSADGYTSTAARRHSCTTVSRKLAVSLRLLAESLGIRTGMSTDNRTTYCIEGRKGIARMQYRLHWQPIRDAKRAPEAFEQGGKVWSRVRSVKSTDTYRTVYNIEVEDDHSYVLDGIVVHNCTHHSRAAGGRPRSNQLRSQPEFVVTWARQTRPRVIIVENVAEVIEWGPLTADGTPDKAHKGELFDAWIRMIEASNYNVEWRILNCADYGDATTRKRFFMVAVRKDLGMPVWPKPTHGNHVTGLKQWRSAGDCLDRDNLGKSIFGRKHPLVRKTLDRLALGARKYWGLEITTDALVKLSDPKRKLRPFIVKLRNHETVESIDNPLSTVTAGGRHHAVVTAQLICDHQRHGKAEPPTRPMKTVSTHDHFSLATLILGQHSGSHCRPASEPLPTACTISRIRTFEPIVVDNANGGIVRGAKEPLNTVTAKDNHMLYLPVLEDGRRLDILMRMLTPRELARSHSLPDSFILKGNKTEQTKQVGNSVPARTACALVSTVLKEYVK